MITDKIDSDWLLEKLETGYDEEMPYDFLDGVMFFYMPSLGATMTQSMCQNKESGEEVMMGADCPWVEESDLWEKDKTYFFGGASRSLDKFH